MELPLLERATEGDIAFHFTHASVSQKIASTCGSNADLIPARTPGDGEQYRFHFDMGSCIGCKCCVVACHEQNGNPADLQWRRVGEIEGGWYPETMRLYLSMGCNHCIDPACMTGCPVDAYTKDGPTGIVRHSADLCIGCQYCTWNCSFGVPQYNPERGVVGKCDMCYGRLTEGDAPACASACPESAIRIEVVNIAEWKADSALSGGTPGMPLTEVSISTTRITQPKNLPRDIRKVNLNRIRPEHPHWPLVFMTVLTQLSVGAFAAIWVSQLTGHAGKLYQEAISSLLIAALALASSTLHLGRPIHAYRALKMWRRSWLSREVLAFTIFAHVAALYAAALWFGLHAAIFLGGVTVLTGAAGVAASARLYIVPARPAWNTSHTFADFFLTSAALGTLFGEAIGGNSSAGRHVTVVCGVVLLLNVAWKFLWLTRSEVPELNATAKLLSTVLSGPFLLRGHLLLVGSIVLPLTAYGHIANWTALAFTLIAELIGRYLFFVSVVPTNIAAEYLGAQEAA